MNLTDDDGYLIWQVDQWAQCCTFKPQGDVVAVRALIALDCT